MSIDVLKLAFYVGGLSAAQKAVLVALADHADDEGRDVFPSVELLTFKTSCGERTVRRALKDLREMGLIHVVREATYHLTTEYRLDLPEMQVRQSRPARAAERGARAAGHGVPERQSRPARAAPKPSYNHHDQPSYNRMPELPTEALPDLSRNQEEQQAEMISAISAVVKQTYAIGMTENEFNSAAAALIARGVTCEQVRGFGRWWIANGHYSGKPAIRSLLAEIDNCIQGVTHSQNGSSTEREDFKYTTGVF